ncbi:MAG: serine hydrolase domain-containing protein [Phycisphaerae bacterium]
MQHLPVRSLATWLSLLALAAITQAQGRDESKTFADGPRGDQIIALVRHAELFDFSGSVLAAVDGKVVAATACGFADAKGKLPNTPATLFEIASATKQFTAASALRLVQGEKLDLDHSISKHLPGIPEDCQAITLRHLLQHTSGIPGNNSMGAGDDIAKVLPSFLRGGPKHTPGTHWEYWNQGYAIASEIIARAGGASYTDICRTLLFEPVAMRATCFTGDAAPAGATVAIGASKFGPSRSALDHPYGAYGFQYRGMGGVVTNVWDLWRWDRALSGNDLLSAASRKALLEAGSHGYALGWFVGKDIGGRQMHSHGGSVRGFVCEIRRYPKNDGCIFVLANDDAAPVRAVADAVAELLFGNAQKSLATPKALDASVQQSLVGAYASGDDANVTIEAADSMTWLRIEWPKYRTSYKLCVGADAGDQLEVAELLERHPLQIAAREGDRVISFTLFNKKFTRK